MSDRTSNGGADCTNSSWQIMWRGAALPLFDVKNQPRIMPQSPNCGFQWNKPQKAYRGRMTAKRLLNRAGLWPPNVSWTSLLFPAAAVTLHRSCSWGRFCQVRHFTCHACALVTLHTLAFFIQRYSLLCKAGRATGEESLKFSFLAVLWAKQH